MMTSLKSLAALMAFFAMAIPALADESKIEVEDLPKAVLKAVKAKFPEAKIRGAAREVEDGETLYEIEMTIDGKHVDVIFEPDGEIEAVEKEIEVEDLPGAVRKAAKAKFPKGKIEKAEEITEEDNKVVYELAIAIKGKETIEVVIAPNGKIIEDEEDEEEAKKGEKVEKKAKKGEKDDAKGEKDDERGKKKRKD